jgi:tryptophan-rich sensory protein
MLGSLLKIFIVVIAAVLGSILTMNGMKVGSEYNNLILSKYQPQSFIFSIVWTFIYISYAYVWVKLPSSNFTNLLFTTNMVLNFLWVYAFFTETNLSASRYIIIGLLLLTLFQAYYVYQLEIEKSGLYIFLLLIYASWLTVASVLNFDIKTKSQ